jgi:hypothetical protein
MKRERERACEREREREREINHLEKLTLPKKVNY